MSVGHFLSQGMEVADVFLVLRSHWLWFPVQYDLPVSLLSQAGGSFVCQQNS